MDFQQALKDFSKAVEIDPNHFHSYRELGCPKYKLYNFRHGFLELEAASMLGDILALELLKKLNNE